MTTITERVWLVTGASRGIGAEIAKAVLASGDKLVATARTLDGLEYLEPSERLLPTVLDVADERQASAAVKAGMAKFGRIDVVVNNAGICLVGAVEETSAEEVEHLYRTNVFGLLNVTRAVLPGMRRRRAGHVINISSVAGYSGYMGFGVYSSTKFAVEAARRSGQTRAGLCSSLHTPNLRLCDYCWGRIRCSGWPKRMPLSSGKRRHGGLWPHQRTTELLAS